MKVVSGEGALLAVPPEQGEQLRSGNPLRGSEPGEIAGQHFALDGGEVGPKPDRFAGAEGVGAGPGGAAKLPP
jgi:hypothetical protein